MQEGQPDRLADLLDEAADKIALQSLEIERLRTFEKYHEGITKGATELAREIDREVLEIALGKKPR